MTYVKVVHSNQQNIAGAIQGLLGVHNLLPGGVLQVYCLSPHLHREESFVQCSVSDKETDADSDSPQMPIEGGNNGLFVWEQLESRDN